MEPAFYRGDLLFLTNPTDQLYKTGDITVYKIPGADIPIVHRVLETHDWTPAGKKEYVLLQRSCCASAWMCLQLIWMYSAVAASPLAQRQRLLTKGDNNHIDDIELYQGLEWLERKHIVGKVRG